jgi:cyclopropane-fatty-acyl-phospholipid synthase
MTWAIELAERGLVPERLVRAGIRRILKRLLAQESERHRDIEAARRAWLASMEAAPIALVPESANQQHYEVPAAFFQAVLGPQLKYSAALWGPGVATLAEAEESMLRLTGERARLADGQRVLELGCGWGSLSLWMARRFPASRIVAVSNSASQRRFVSGRALALGLSNLEVVTADMNDFEAPEPRFDRIVSVEMFEHMRNWSALLHRVRRWLADDGRVFLHVFAHQTFSYPYGSGEEDWMGRNFFSGGMMPSLDLFDRVASPFRVEERHEVSGLHYARTLEAWLKNLDERSGSIEALFARDLGARAAKVQLERWRIFLLACAELFAFGGGSEWLVAHRLLAPLPGPLQTAPQLQLQTGIEGRAP